MPPFVVVNLILTHSVVTVLSSATDNVQPSRCYFMMVLDFGSATNDCRKVGSSNGQPVHLTWLPSIRTNWAVCCSNNMGALCCLCHANASYGLQIIPGQPVLGIGFHFLAVPLQGIQVIIWVDSIPYACVNKAH